jgi:hypothetical protein
MRNVFAMLYVLRFSSEITVSLHGKWENGMVMEEVWTSCNCNCNGGMHVNHDDEAFPSTRLLPNEGRLEPCPLILKSLQAGVHGCKRLG